ncbi:hypothetical protein Patl1_37650 [Pistacia atlantica]|nr:hypothetical protein Patl1_37650 [Pistacia atlantica]
MVNLSCQLQGFVSLIKDLRSNFLLFVTVTEDAQRVNGITKVGGAEDAEVGYTRFKAIIIVVIFHCLT